MLSNDLRNHNPHVNPEKIDKYVRRATIAWLYVTFMASIVRGGQMNAFDVLGVIVGTATAFGHWLKCSWPLVVVEAIFAGKLLLILAMLTLLAAWPLGYLGFA